MDGWIRGIRYIFDPHPPSTPLWFAFSAPSVPLTRHHSLLVAGPLTTSPLLNTNIHIHIYIHIDLHRHLLLNIITINHLIASSTVPGPVRHLTVQYNTIRGRSNISTSRPPARTRPHESFHPCSIVTPQSPSSELPNLAASSSPSPPPPLVHSFVVGCDSSNNLDLDSDSDFDHLSYSYSSYYSSPYAHTAYSPVTRPPFAFASAVRSPPRRSGLKPPLSHPRPAAVDESLSAAAAHAWPVPLDHPEPLYPPPFLYDRHLFPTFDDNAALPLFPSAYPAFAPVSATMAGPASPIDIATSRQNSSSPRNASNLTSQLQNPKIDVRHDAVPANGDAAAFRGRQESNNMLGTTPFGARSIPFREGVDHRESLAGLSGSLMGGGMSWGGISMGSFIRDDLMMTGTSPYNYNGFQSPSFHSSSYLPKMEANYMKDYVCCDIHLDSMHELLQHYEEAHAAQPTQTMGRTPKDQQFPSSRAANATSTAQAVQQQAQAQQPLMQTMIPQDAPLLARNPALVANTSPLFSGQSSDQVGTFDGLDDMDMDDGTPSLSMQQQQGFQPQPHFGRQQPRGHTVNVNVASAFQGPGLASAGPTTPRAAPLGLANNPTVSSVNTPTLGTQTSFSRQTSTPDSSMPGTPADLSDLDYAAQMGNIDYNALMQNNFDFNSLNLNNGAASSTGNNNHNNAGNGGVSGTIDDPAKRLLSKQGYGNKGFTGNAAFANGNSELAKKVREHQLLNGLAGVGGFVGEETKPFKCPVIGCEKAYKNQNGLKYHKQHGHQNQQLKENPDGTFSIVDPATSIPYPGTVGMEKEKPYRCEVCGKRYKNLNGLKYHRQHSPQCNPELKLAAANLPNVAGMSANVAGAGLMGMDGMGY